MQSIPKEADSLAFVEHAQLTLNKGLNGLSGKQHSGGCEHYLVQMSRMVNVASESYVILRKSGRIEGSKLLVRPILEATFNACAVHKDPEFLFGKALEEIDEDGKLFKWDTEKKAQEIANIHAAFAEHCPDLPRTGASMNTWLSATKAGLSEDYQVQYRVYCQYTHGALRAVMGGLTEIDQTDSCVVGRCLALVLKELIAHTAAECPISPEMEAAYAKMEE
jgi:hypothetical protein